MKDSFTEFKDRLDELPFAIKATMCLTVILIVMAFRIGSWFERQNIARAAEGVLRNEYASANTYALAKGISDLENLGIIHCVRLFDRSESKIPYYDTTKSSGCWTFKPIANWITVKESLFAINGTRYQLEFQQQRRPASIFLEIFCYVFVLLAFNQYAKYSRRQKINADIRVKIAQAERELTLNAANQIRHDVASPLGALRIIVNALQNMDPEVRNLMVNAITRTEQIFGQLKDNLRTESFESPAEPVDLNRCLLEIVNEKKALWKDEARLCVNSNDTKKIRVFANEMELKRIFSNLLNNAFEAHASHPAKIEISTMLNSANCLVEIQDAGVGMTAAVIEKLGTRGFTLGKESGSGLGVSNAIKCLRKWGGDIRYESNLNKGTKALIFLKPIY